MVFDARAEITPLITFRDVPVPKINARPVDALVPVDVIDPVDSVGTDRFRVVRLVNDPYDATRPCELLVPVDVDDPKFAVVDVRDVDVRLLAASVPDTVVDPTFSAPIRDVLALRLVNDPNVPSIPPTVSVPDV